MALMTLRMRLLIFVDFLDSRLSKMIDSVNDCWPSGRVWILKHEAIIMLRKMIIRIRINVLWVSFFRQFHSLVKWVNEPAN